MLWVGVAKSRTPPQPSETLPCFVIMESAATSSSSASASQEIGVVRSSARSLYNSVKDLFSSVKAAGTAVSEVSKCPYFQYALGRDDHDGLPPIARGGEQTMRCPYAESGAALPANHPMIPGMFPTKAKPANATDSSSGGGGGGSSSGGSEDVQSLAAAVQAVELQDGAEEGMAKAAGRAQTPTSATLSRNTTTTPLRMPFAHSQEAEAVALFKQVATTNRACADDDPLAVD